MPKSFAEKYNLVGKGNKVVISNRTKNLIESLNAQGRRYIEAGKDFVKNCNIRFGA